MKLLVKTLAGLEEVLAKELEALGAQEITLLKRAVSCTGDQQLVYKANLWLRCGLRVLVPFAEFDAPHEDALYDQVRSINWAEHLQLHQTFAIDAVTQSNKMRHSHYLALKTKDGIVDWFRDHKGRRPSVNPKSPNIRFHLHLDHHNRATLLRDSSGEGLHRRGYRTSGGQAPLNEVLAAGLVQLSGWKADQPFVDPMCGSGTILIEAAGVATRQAPGLYRSFAFEQWQDFNQELWQSIKTEARALRQPTDIPILGCDHHFKALRIAENNISAAHMKAYIRVKRSTFQKFLPPEGPGTLVTNPPYGLRVDNEEDVTPLYQELGDKLKKDFAGYEAWVFSGNVPALKQLGLRASRRLHLMNGQIECKLHKFELYKGSRKPGQGMEGVV